MSEPLLHMTTAALWRAAGPSGRYQAPSLHEQGFIHLSTAEQVPLPANALFAGRSDVVLLCIDPRRLRAPVRWEPGAADDPTGMRFPHLYGDLPVRAVTAVLPYRPDGDGHFHRPGRIPTALLDRIFAFEHHLARGQSAHVLEVEGGFAVLHPGFPVSWEHNRLIIDSARAPAEVIAMAEDILGAAGLPYRQISIDTGADVPAADFVTAGYRLHRSVLMAAGELPDRPRSAVRQVSAVELADLRPMLHRGWARELPGLGEAERAQLVDRGALLGQAAEVTRLAVRAGGQWVARTELFVNGATAQIEDVMTEPEHRRRGYAGALVHEAAGIARAAGCDLVFLRALADDWPRHFYRRLGFVDVGAALELHREPQRP